MQRGQHKHRDVGDQRWIADEAVGDGAPVRTVCALVKIVACPGVGAAGAQDAVADIESADAHDASSGQEALHKGHAEGADVVRGHVGDVEGTACAVLAPGRHGGEGDHGKAQQKTDQDDQEDLTVGMLELGEVGDDGAGQGDVEQELLEHGARVVRHDAPVA